MSATEIIQRNELTTLLLRQGYNVFIPVYDEGIDLIAHRELDDDLKLIQQKSRWTIARKYVGRNIWIAFRDRGEWFLAPHDEMVRLGEAAGFTDSQYTSKGATVATRDELFAAEIIAQVRAFGANQTAGRADLARMRDGQIVVGMCDPLGALEASQEIAATGVAGFSFRGRQV